MSTWDFPHSLAQLLSKVQNHDNHKINYESDNIFWEIYKKRRREELTHELKSFSSSCSPEYQLNIENHAQQT